MVVTLTKRSKKQGQFEPEDLLALQKSYELLDGRLVERNVGDRRVP